MHQHEEQALQQMGVPQHQIDDAKARGLNFGKLLPVIFGFIQQLLASGAFGGAGQPGQAQQAPGQPHP